MTNYAINKKDNSQVQFTETDKGVNIVSATGEEKTVSASTFKRWYTVSEATTKATEKNVKASTVAVLEKPEVKENIAVILPAPKAKKELIATPKQLKKAVETKVTESQMTKKTYDKIEAKQAKATRDAEAITSNEANLTALKNFAKDCKCDISENNTNIAIKCRNRNIAVIKTAKTTADIYLNYASIPAEVFNKNKLECVPEEWKFTLQVRVKLTAANVSMTKELIKYGVDYINGKYEAKEKAAQAKVERAEKRAEAVKAKK